MKHTFTLLFLFSVFFSILEVEKHFSILVVDDEIQCNIKPVGLYAAVISAGISHSIYDTGSTCSTDESILYHTSSECRTSVIELPQSISFVSSI